jgi:hypothetical protein
MEVEMQKIYGLDLLMQTITQFILEILHRHINRPTTNSTGKPHLLTLTPKL